MKKFLLSVAIILLSACGTQGTINASLMDQPIEAKHSRIIINRTNSLLYLGAAAEVSMNGRKIASLAKGASIIEDIPAGKHNLSVIAPTTFGSYTTSFEAKSGKTYRFEIAPNDQKSTAPGLLFGYVGEAVEAQNKGNTGYFKIVLKRID